jgi:hypothetical protein
MLVKISIFEMPGEMLAVQNYVLLTITITISAIAFEQLQA